MGKKINNHCNGFALWKYDFHDHPMQKERKKYRKIYYLLFKEMLSKLVGEHQVHDVLVKKLKVSLRLTNFDLSPIPFERLCEEFSSKIFWHGGFSWGWIDHRILLLIETATLAWCFNDKIEKSMIDSYGKMLHIEDDEMVFIDKYVNRISIGNNEIGKIRMKNHSTDRERALNYLKKQWKKEYERKQKPQYNVAICATMSSGKSTVMNALLGNNIFPFGNRACTAKIISFEDDPEQEKIIGGKKTIDGRIYYEEIKDDVLELWNEENVDSRIYLTGNIEGINSQGRNLCLYDTPGTNSSQNAIHEDMTKKLLEETTIDTVLYVCNAEQAGTTDEAYFLKWLKKNIVDKKSVEIIFIVNKFDSVDIENENPIEFLAQINDNLKQIGFENIILIPISAGAACLFRMALRGEPMTKKSKLDLKKYYNYFVEMNQDFRELIKVNYLGGDNKDVNVTDASGMNLLKAIEYTGITVLEKILEQRVKGEV